MSKLNVLQRTRKTLRAAMFGAALGICGALPAQAAVFAGAWDPAFGSAFPDLGWGGEAKFFVPDACLAETGWVFNFESCSSSGMKLLSAEVDFYKLSDPTNTAFQETLSFDIPSDFVLAMKIDDGELAGVFGSFLYSRPSTLAIAGGGYTDFVLFFQGDIARMGFVSYPPNGHKTVGLSDVNPPDGRPFITFRAVPEPSSLPLFFAALGMLALFSLRRQPTR